MKVFFQKNWQFLIIPLAFLTISILYIYFEGIYFLSTVDPEFAYLFNGITLAHFQPHLNCVGHPGTPIQVLIAVTSWVVHLFRPGQSLWHDVMTNPDVYIKAAVGTASVINTVFLFMLGHYVYKYSKNLTAALVLQLTPFAFLYTLEIANRLMPDLIMTSIVSVWIILLVKILFEPEEIRNYKKYSLWFALLFGFSIANKLTFLPYYFMPLMLLPGWRLKLRYTIISIPAFFLFAFPVMLNFSRFYWWTTLLFMHKGKYGQGEEGILDVNAFFNNILEMIGTTRQIWIPLAILVVLSIIWYIKNKKIDMAIRISIGLFLVLLFQYMIVAKHYSFYYLTPSLLLALFTGFMSYYMLVSSFPVLKKRFSPLSMLVLFGIVLLINNALPLKNQLNGLRERKALRTAVFKEISPLLKDSPRIICPNYYGSSTIEYALQFGIFESGRHAKKLTGIYQELYPSCYFYMSWEPSFWSGSSKLEPNDFLMPHTEYTIYMSDYSEESMKQVINQLQSDSLKYRFNLREVYQSQATAEAVFTLSVGDQTDAVSGSTLSAY